jgi:hypothetical protein
MKIKTNFAQGDKLPAQDLNNNFAVIEKCINNTERGLSAYEQSLFEGDEQAWLSSLRGPQGPEGKQGPKGIDSPTAGGYAYFTFEQISGLEGNNNCFSECELGTNTLNAQVIKDNDKAYLYLETPNIKFLKILFNSFYFEGQTLSVEMDIIEVVVDVYNEDRTELLKTYKGFHERTAHLRHNFLDSKVDLMDSMSVSLDVDVTNLDKCNLLIKLNILKSENDVLVEGQLDYSGEPHCVIEAFS